VASSYTYAPVRGWDETGDAAFIRPCIKYSRTTGQFRIVQDGLYIIISHLAFLGPSISTDLFAQKVMRVGFSEPVLVDMRRGVSTDLAPGSAPVQNSVTAGITRLRADDLLYVEAKPADKLAVAYSYFSVVKLQDGA